ncbi:MAG TPA: patatin-like phospholipase family protein [Gemmatimonadales bacterium]|nr:patatin-like phospholipase family protein [Gemmatimonadales bacterium]
MPDEPTTSEVTAPEDPPVKFEEVYLEECSAVRGRRRQSRIPVSAEQALTDLRGLALSGGGIRSATFCLGVLQQLAAEGRLKCFDYLSTVSGGGFIGGWWTAWLSRTEQRSAEADRAGAPGIFPDAEGLELDRQGNPAAYTPDGSRSAGVDPVHHVRLFSNYLTPKKGALSADTWRAITVVSRNLVITLLTLLPILGSAVLVAQLYFVADEHLAAAFACGAAPAAPATVAPAGVGAEAGAAGQVCAQFESSLRAHPWDLKVRLARVLVPVVVLLAWLVLVTLFWALAGTGDLRLAAVALAAVVVMLALTKHDVAFAGGTGILAEMRRSAWFLPLLLGGALILTVWTAYLGFRRIRLGDGPAAPRSLSASQGEVLTNRLTRFQTVILSALVFVGVVLVFGGFGHELVGVAFAQGRAGVGAYVSKAGGWAAVILALAGSVFTAIKAAPTGGSDTGGNGKAGRLTSFAFMVTPPLVIVVLLLALATGSHALLGTLAGPHQGVASNLHVALLVAMGICAVFACYEYIAGEHSGRSRAIVILGAAVLGLVAYLLPLPPTRRWATAIAGFGLGLVAVPWLALELLPKLRRFVEQRSRRNVSKARPGLLAGLVVVLTPIVLGGIGWALGTISSMAGFGTERVTRAALAGMTFAAALLALLPIASRKTNLRTMWLLSLVYVLLGTLYIEQFLDPSQPQVFLPQAIVAFIGVALATVIGLGWLTDPNYLSLHTFYRARLVRAYLGASNEARLNAEITESVDGDDLQLADLVSGARPGPYHLVNATLNLVAARDLATAQRSAAGFTFSPRHCGSLRTGYRPTRGYMGGRLTLGAALAVSGAAASPNMGAKTLSAPLAMLMALLNVRLGFWAPNPAKERWRVPRPRLWPFYMLREFLSQTNDLSSYCYLTDGGHFDNTGLYSLVQRGCRSIFLVDCGADPRPCFADIGDAIRRCRIDFRSEITLSVNDFIRPSDQRLSSAHFVVGEVRYDREHLRDLGWGDVPDPAARKGVIVWVKPSLLKDDPAEVRQYALENDAFPQQTTGDQWFDEAQFESYRRLGAECARTALADSRVAEAFPAL